MSAVEGDLKLPAIESGLKLPAIESDIKLVQGRSSLNRHVNFSLEEFPHTFNDERDTSRHPSFTRFSVPYHIICARRYASKRREYEQQFEHEIFQLINYMDSGASAVTFGRQIAYTSLWPPLHTRVEIKNTEKFFRLGKKQSERLTYLMENVIN